MRKIAVDVGLARIGVAISVDSLAIPHSVISQGQTAIAELVDIYNEKNAECIYVGLPLSLRGGHTASTRMAIDFAELIALQGIPVRLIDERLTSKTAQQSLRQAGKNAKQQKSIIDASAACLILEFALASEKHGELAGRGLDNLDD
jgi:putative Holliday junction resolvase